MESALYKYRYLLAALLLIAALLNCFLRFWGRNRGQTTVKLIGK